MVTFFLKDFLHPDREKVEEMVVFLHRYSMATYFLKDFLYPDKEKVEEMVVFLHRYSMATYFLKDFLHPDREKVEEMVVFLHRYADISKWSLTSSRTSSIPTWRRWRRWSFSCTDIVCRYFKLVTTS
jgi:hypothetical protein